MLRKLTVSSVKKKKLTNRPAVVLATSPETAHPEVVVVDSDLSVVPEDSVDPRSAT